MNCIVICPNCGQPYIFFYNLDTDQSVCPNCRRKINKTSKYEENK